MKIHLLLSIALFVGAPAFAVTYDEWRDSYFPSYGPAFSSESADPDGDGKSNMLEFAIGTDPWLPETTE